MGAEYHDLGHPLHPFRIEKVWMILAYEEDPEGRMAEGMPARNLGPLMVPLLATDERRLEQITQWAQEIAQVTGKTMKLVEFTERRELREIGP